MSLIGWLIIGVICGLVANKMSDGKRGNWALDGVLGVAGAIGGGGMFCSFGGSIHGFNTASMVVAVLGAVAALLTYHALFVYPGRGED